MAAKAAANKEKVGGVINTVLKGLDEHIADYIIGVLEDDPLQRVSWVPGEAGRGRERVRREGMRRLRQGV
jgi:hypothetical protein